MPRQNQLNIFSTTNTKHSRKQNRSFGKMELSWQERNLWLPQAALSDTWDERVFDHDSGGHSLSLLLHDHSCSRHWHQLFGPNAQQSVQAVMVGDITGDAHRDVLFHRARRELGVHLYLRHVHGHDAGLTYGTVVFVADIEAVPDIDCDHCKAVAIRLRVRVEVVRIGIQLLTLQRKI